MKHWEWVESNYGCKCSDFGKDVAQILGIAWSGVYHISTNFKKTDFTNEYGIRVDITYPQLSTFDFSRLTQLVVLCHDACIRLEIKPHTFSSCTLWFHRKDGRDWKECSFRNHPSMEEAIERVRAIGGPKYEDRTSCAQEPAQNTKEICHTAPNTAIMPDLQLSMVDNLL